MKFYIGTIQLFRERLSEKKHRSERDRMGILGGLGIHWNFSYWPRGNVQVCIFAHGEFDFSLRRPLSVHVGLLLWLNIPCFHMFEVKENLKISV